MTLFSKTGVSLAAMMSAACAADGEPMTAGDGGGAFAAATAQRHAPSALPPQDVTARLLAAHNRYRSQAGVPPLAWDAALAAGAAAYGPALAARGSLAHSPRTQRPGIGENLWMGTAGAYSPEAMVDAWGSERAMYRDGIFPAVSTTGNWLDVAHYTQMIWRTTTRVGCAVHRSGRRDYLICRYSPSGNRDGQRPR